MKANRKDSKRQNKALVGRGKSTPVRTAKKSVLIRDGAALEYSEGRLQAIFEQSPLSIQIFSADGDVLGANRAWEELWVSHREQLKGYNVLEDPQVKARGLLPYFERALSGETVFLPPAYYDPAEIGQKGRARWTRAVIYPVIDASGQVREIVVIHEDVTERYEAEQSTLLSEQRFRSLFENSPVSIWEEDFSELKSYLDELTKTGITDLDAYLTAHPEVIIKCIELVKIVDVNRAGMKLYEAGSKADLLGGLHKTFPPDSRLGFKAEILRIARGELRYESEGKAQTLQGNVRDVLVHWVVAPGHERTYSKVLVSLTDITELKQAEEKLRTAEAKYRTLIEKISPIVYTAEPEQHIGVTYISPQIEQLGFSQEEWSADPDLWLKRLHPDDRERILAQLDELNGSVDPFQGEYRLITRDGQVRWFYDHAFPVKDAEGRTLFRQGYMLDITERKQAETHIRQYADIVGNMQIGLYVFHLEDREDDRSFKLVSANPAALEFSGVMAEEVVGKTLDEGFPDLRAMGIPQKYVDVIRTQMAVEIETSYYDDKQQLDTVFAVKAFPLPNEHVGVAFENITERKRAEELLQNSERRFRALIENSSEEVSLLSADGRLLYESPSANPTLGYAPGEFLGHSLFQIVHSEDLERVQVLFTDLIQMPGSSVRAQFRLRHKSGEWRWVEAVGTNLLDEPAVQAIVVNYHDITERKQVEDALQKSEERYRTLFEDSPISIWEEDFSKVKEYFDELRSRGVTDFREYFEGHREAVIECLRRVQVVDVNHTTLDLMQVRDKSELLTALSDSLSEDAIPTVAAELISLAEGNLSYESDEVFTTRRGEKRQIYFRLTVAPGYEETLGKVFVSIVDITDRKRAETDLINSYSLLNATLESTADGILVVDASGKVTSFNSKFLELWRIPIELADQRDDQVLINYVLDQLDDPASFITKVQELYSSSAQTSIDELKFRDGRIFERYSQAQILDDKIVGRVWSFRDVTERKKAQSELQASEERFRLLASNIREVFWITDPVAQKVVYLSPAYEEVWGRRLEDQLQNTDLFLETVLPEDAQRVRATIERQRRGEKTEMEYRIRRPDGSIRWIWDRAFPFVDESRKVKLITGIAADITERKKAEVETLRHLDELQALYENGLAVGRLLTSREIGERVIQTFTQYLLWHHVTIRLRKGETDDLELIAFSVPDMKEEDKEGTAQNFTTRISKVGQGMSGWVVQTGVPIRTGNVHEYPQYVDTYEGIRSGMYMPLQVGDQIIGSISVESELPDAFTLQDERLLATLSTQAAVAFENARLYQAVQQELSERRRAEAMLEQERNSLAQRVEERTSELIAANTNLARALRVKDEFLANMSHELRTPLNAILGLSESLGEQVAGPLNEKQQKYVQTITESGHHLLALINDILDLAKIDAGQVTLDFSKVDVHSLCQSSLRMVKQMAQKKNQEVMLEIDDEIGLIWADERRLKQMIVNLLSNAVKFTQEGGKLGLEVRGDKEENRVLISVWDHGIGIADDDIAKLFQPFVQLSTGLARESTGTGLGLALVAQMARLHGGGVSVSSIPGEGSRFTLVLPWEPALAVDTVERMKVTGKFRAVRNIGEHERRKILLIEDTPDVVMMVRDYLEASGYNVAVAEDGLEGIAQAKRVHPDLILMDLQMPRMDGFEATKKLRLDPDFRTTPIIALTALAMQGDRERCLAAGMDEYITKPVNLKGLVKIIEACLTIPQEKKPESQ